MESVWYSRGFIINKNIAYRCPQNGNIVTKIESKIGL